MKGAKRRAEEQLSRWMNSEPEAGMEFLAQAAFDLAELAGYVVGFNGDTKRIELIRPSR